ncbi:MAG TPA: glycerophosphodiester phosphodiesterase family protein [Alphaproteobacteria bacterium]|nr:glycerophosphodiester phosphodiesterase family protein [Alphaproteobacteria bacterium]HNS44731.1 glycerophosphodiester phosphodiesterase family protein [Alphaproteobacteria bacterium]
MPLKLPTIIGNRGAAAYAPENTIESIHTAADMGCKWVEFDVKLTKDSVPILFHDDLLDRTTNGHGPVADMKFSDLRDLECGSWFSDGFGGIKIPTLEEAVEVILERDLGMNVELKPCPGREVETAEAALDLLSQIWDDRDRLLISSFSHVSLETAMDMAGDWYRSLLLESEPAENWAELADYLNATTINIDGRTASREFIEEIMDTERPVLAYTINDPQLARTLRAWGVDAMFTDDPDTVNDTLFKAH